MFKRHKHEIRKVYSYKKSFKYRKAVHEQGKCVKCGKHFGRDVHVHYRRHPEYVR